MDIKRIRKITPSNPPKDFPQRSNHPDLDISSFSEEKITQPILTPQRGFSWLKVFSLFLSAILVIALAYGIFIGYKFNSTSQKINIENSEAPSFFKTIKELTSGKHSSLKGQEEGRINILLLGMAGAGKPGSNLTDTIIVASVDTRNNKSALLSIPRDLYVEVKDSNLKQGGGMHTKINSVFQYGLNSYQKDEKEAARVITETVENITSLQLDYYLILNFEGFEKTVDAIGGINITNERDILDTRYPGPNYSYETFELKKGFHWLDGKTALKYVRERHNDPEGDFGRAKRQQQVMQAIKNKVFSLGTLLDAVAINNVFDTLGENVRTNIKPEEIGGFIELAKNTDTNNISNVVIDAWKPDSLLKVSHINFESSRAFILVPRIGNFSEIQERARKIFDLDSINRRKNEISRENAKILLINESGDTQVGNKIAKSLQEYFGYDNVNALKKSVSEEILREKTAISDLTFGLKPFTLDELVKLFSTSSGESEPETLSPEQTKETDIILILGKDITNVYNTEEITQEEFNQANDYQDFLPASSFN